MGCRASKDICNPPQFPADPRRSSVMINVGQKIRPSLISTTLSKSILILGGLFDVKVLAFKKCIIFRLYFRLMAVGQLSLDSG